MLFLCFTLLCFSLLSPSPPLFLCTQSFGFLSISSNRFEYEFTSIGWIIVCKYANSYFPFARTNVKKICASLLFHHKVHKINQWIFKPTEHWLGVKAHPKFFSFFFFSFLFSEKKNNNNAISIRAWIIKTVHFETKHSKKNNLPSLGLRFTIFHREVNWSDAKMILKLHFFPVHLRLYTSIWGECSNNWNVVESVLLARSLPVYFIDGIHIYLALSTFAHFRLG